MFYSITFDDVLVFCRGIVSLLVLRYFRQVLYRSHNFGIVTTLACTQSKTIIKVKLTLSQLVKSRFFDNVFPVIPILYHYTPNIQMHTHILYSVYPHTGSWNTETTYKWIRSHLT